MMLPFVFRLAAIALVALALTAFAVFYWGSRQRRRQRRNVERVMRDLDLLNATSDVAAVVSPTQPGDTFAWLERVSSRTGFDTLLVQSGTRRRAELHLLAALLAACAGGLLVLLVTANVIVCLAFALAFASLPILRLVQVRANRARLFDEQLPDALDFMASALRAGHSLAQSFGMIAEEMPSPIGDEFRLVNEKIAFGVAFQDAITQLRDRVPSRDLDFLVVGLLIQRETGGNIADLFLNLARLGRERVKLAGRINVLSAEGKLSGWLLGGLPFALAGGMTLLSPEYMAPLWSTDQGRDLILAGLGMMGVGFVWMNQMVRLKV
jgi:tight adherence protein B